MLKQITGYPGGKNGLWSATCDECGKHVGGLWDTESQAMKPLLAHMKDKHPGLIRG